MGTVHRAMDLETGSFVALKTIDDDPRFADRFTRERRLLQEISHPSIVGFIGSGTHQDRPFLVMEWIEGCDLADALARGPLAIGAALTLCELIANALSAAHARGVVHRDVKPKNLMLMHGSVSDPKLTDFGIARLDKASRSLTQLGTAVGTPGYMAPEQVQSAGGVDARADVFSLGCVLFACVTARNPYAAETAFASMARVVGEEPPRLRDLWPDIPPMVDELCAALMAKAPAERPADGGEASALIAACARSLEDSELRYQPRSHLGPGEQRLTSAVFVELAAKADCGSTPVTAGPDETVVGPSYALDEVVHGWLRGFGREAQVIGPTTFAVLFDGPGASTDLAAKAIACALGLASRLRSERVLVVSAPRDVSRGDLGELAERAQNLLRDLAPTSSAADVVLVDATTSSLSAGVFSFADDVGGAFRILPSATTETVLPAPPSPLFGRDRERELIELTFCEVFDEHAARAILVEGPSGCGKTSLIEHALSRVHVERPNVHAVRLKPRTPNLSGSVDLFRACATPSYTSAQEFQNHVRDKLGVGPVVVFVDDLRFADRASLDVLGVLVSSARESPLAVIGALRSEDRSNFPRLWQDVDVLDIRLPGLSRAAIDQAILETLGPAHDPDLARKIHDGAGGNPFRLVEMLRAAKDGCAAIPEAVLALISAQLQELGESDRALLRAASVFGDVFWARGVATMVDQQRSKEVEPRLRALAQRGYLAVHPVSQFDGELELSFKQTMIREAAYASLLTTDRALAHTLAADWLSATNGDIASIATHRRLAESAREEERQRL